MKKNLYLMAAAMTAALALGACSNDDENAVNGVDLSKPISLSFSPAPLDVQTRATIGVTGAAFESGDQVGVYVDGAGYSNILYTCGGASWSTASDLYWPDAGTYTFRAYYPYMETVDGAVALPADQGTKEAFTQADRMWTSAARAASNGNITLTLEHKMSLIKLDVSEGEAITLDDIKAMTPAIHGNISTAGTWDLTTGAISLAADATTVTGITPYRVDNGTSVTYYALVIPGTTFEEGDRFFSLTDAEGTTYSYELNIDGGFTAGQSQYCDIDLTVNRTGISLSGFGIGNWTPGQSGSGTVEI